MGHFALGAFAVCQYFWPIDLCLAFGSPEFLGAIDVHESCSARRLRLRCVVPSVSYPEQMWLARVFARSGRRRQVVAVL